MKKTALLVIDMQRYFCEPGCNSYFKSASSIVANVKELIKAFKEKNLPVILTRHAHEEDAPSGQMGKWWKDKLIWQHSPESEIIAEIDQKAADFVLTKSVYSAFEGTDLEKWLKQRDVDSVVLCGVMTNLCVETTARHAFMKDFDVIVVEDACGAKIAAFHEASILNLSYGFAKIVKTNEILAQMDAK